MWWFQGFGGGGNRWVAIIIQEEMSGISVPRACRSPSLCRESLAVPGHLSLWLWGGLSLASTTRLPLFPSLKIPDSVSPGTLKKNLKRQHKRNQAFYNNNRQKSFSPHYLDFPGFDLSTTEESFIVLYPHPKKTTVYSRRKSRSVPGNQAIDKKLWNHTFYL